MMRVSTSWLSSVILSKSAGGGVVRVIDASWHMPSANRNARTEYFAKHIPFASFVDIDHVSDTSSSYPHMMPTAAHFAECMSALRIRDSDTIVVYDSVGIFSAPRLYWMFRAFQHKGDVSILDGGLPKWVRDGYGVESSAIRETAPMGVVCHSAYDAASSATYSYPVPKLNTGLIKTLGQMQSLSLQLCGNESGVSAAENVVVLDARSADRFYGRQPEPRPGLPAGHMPGAKNVPFGSVLTTTGEFKSPDELKTVFAARGVRLEDPEQHVVLSCGSGVTACVLFSALEIAGVDRARMAVYDGSYSEWAAQKDAPISTAD
ncbi:mitochondrial rhodanese-related sulfurtransferase/oxidoreductase family protein [Andalucia godoyi]|uniref:Mitochondrial rhodanese-related sulfurtransferase/oxidoreductase family protein n=1 Tax=Andalucia godoyi TaxID=505711 RepID=A0A8K0F0W2_ANDGO|nr:mitochondrial rhodanese-related sulfurtransferase/oxidoreductase family protein [Andalucia godoyi]|eukprot:ANDGO_05705.mRNA.1 mitochondrial rhodanese-related sulfurtransferase/oxidoreductase family protein (adenylyltransferase and sulfurtransferase)